MFHPLTLDAPPARRGGPRRAPLWWGLLPVAPVAPPVALDVAQRARLDALDLEDRGAFLAWFFAAR